jgi:cysteine desulfurase/selenocysteine lyase
MTTQTPTSDSVAGLSAGHGLPDEALLNRLASEFFALAPGSASIVAEVASRFTGQPDTDTPNLAPVTAPAVVGASVPAFSSSVLPLPAVSAVPTPHASALAGNHDHPSVDSGRTQAPYYFLDQAKSTSTDQLETLARQGQSPTATEDRSSARSFGLPGADDLQQLLKDIFSAQDVRPAQTSAASGTNHFYFQDTFSTPPESTANPVQNRAAGYPGFDIHRIRRDFPILAERVNGHPLVWFDNAATTQKPQSVIDRLAYFYSHENSNIHRAAHELAARATDAYEGARNKVARFLGAKSADEIIFVRGATEAINLVAQTFGKQFIQAGDEIIVSQLEHHANIVPWQQLAAEKGAHIRVIPVDDSGQILIDEYRKLLNSKTRLVSVTQVSNALGTITPVHEIVQLAHAAGAKVLIDGAQAVSHLRVNVQALDADFYVFSGHKIFGPTGIGVVYGKAELLAQLPPWQGGGNMIADVTFERTLYQAAPARFEAGTGNIADAVGLGAALDYVDQIGLEKIAAYEHGLLEYATHHLRSIRGVRLIGTAREKASVASFVLHGYPTEEVGKALNQEGIAVRSGHHCAQPILRRFGVEATVRPSFAFYNTCEEIDRLIAVVRRLTAKK